MAIDARIDILRISAILTDTDRIRIVIFLFERIRIRILCDGYSTDKHYAFILFYLSLNFVLLFGLLYLNMLSIWLVSITCVTWLVDVEVELLVSVTWAPTVPGTKYKQ